MNGGGTVAKAVKEAAAKPTTRCKAGGGMLLGRGHSREAQRQAALILEVLAGVRTPTQAAEVLSVSVPRYYQLEGRALGGLLAACEPCPRGRVRNPNRELAMLRRQHERLQRELARLQALVRLAQRSIGLAPPAPAPKDGSKKRRRRARVRALGAATHLHELSQQQALAPERQEQTA
jgi:hypothetical protein